MRGKNNLISVFKTALTVAQQSAKGLEIMEDKEFILLNF